MTVSVRAALLAAMMGLVLSGCRWLERDGVGAIAGIEWLERTSAADTGLRVQWFGVTTLLIRDADTAILIDGFFSRPSLEETLFARLTPKPDRIDAALPPDTLPALDAVLVSHSHYDHALDAPYVARTRHAVLVGSGSTMNIANAEGKQPERRRQVKHGDRIRIGSFDISVLATPHVPTLIGGAIGEGFAEPARFYDYKLGDNFSFLLQHPQGDILVVPSAGSSEAMFKGVHADVVFLGIATLGTHRREATAALWTEAVVHTGARLVIPVHWDDFSRPFTEALLPIPWPIDNIGASLRTLEELTRAHCDREVRIKLMPLAQPVSLAKALSRPSRPPPPAPSC
jgi:L-ascorbate metabolism protein UlaG (beta-lactamase superfamily)